MVGDTANGDRITAYILYDTTDVCEDLWQVLFSYTDARTLHVEDDVDVQFCVCVCHSVVFCAGTYVACLLVCHPYGVLLSPVRDSISVCRRRKSLRFQSKLQPLNYNSTPHNIRLRFMVNHPKLPGRHA